MWRHPCALRTRTEGVPGGSAYKSSLSLKPTRQSIGQDLVSRAIRRRTIRVREIVGDPGVKSGVDPERNREPLARLSTAVVIVSRRFARSALAKAIRKFRYPFC